MMQVQSIGKTFLLIPIAFGFLIICLIAALSPLAGLVFVFGILLTFLAFYRLDIILLLTFMAIPLEELGRVFPNSNSPVANSITVAKLLIIIVMFSWLIKAILLKNDVLFKKSFNNPLTIAIYLFISISIISAINAGDLPLFVFQLIREINSLFLLLLIINLIEEEKIILRIFWGTLLSYILVGLIGLYEIITQKHFLWLIGYQLKPKKFTLMDESFRIIGTSGDPDFHAIAMLLPAFLAIMFIYHQKSKFLKITMIPIFLLFLVNLLGSASRGAMIALLAGLMVFIIFMKTRYKVLILVSAITLVVATTLVYTLTISEIAASSYTLQSRTKTLQYRSGWAKMAIDMVMDHPLIGIGTYNFPTEYNRYIVPEVPRTHLLTHNSYLQVLSENGILGLFVFLSLFVLAGRNLYRVLKTSNSPAINAMALSTFSALWAYMAFAGTSNILTNENYWILFAFSIVLFNLAGSKTEKTEILAQ